MLVVAPSVQKRTSKVTLSGHTRQAGDHDLNKAKTLSALLQDEKVMGDDIYPLMGIIERRDPDKLTKELIDFSPYQVLQKTYDHPLHDGDQVHLFSLDQIIALEKETPQPLLHQASFTSRGKIKDAQDKMIDPLIGSFMKERAAFVRGAVRKAGAYPVTNNTSLNTLLAVAGGLTLEANSENIELTSRTDASRERGRQMIGLLEQDATQILIGPGDTIRINQKFHKIADQSVRILGEVNHPGQYDLMPGDTLSKLIKRAGNITAQGYPDGAIFSRASERKREQSRFKAQAQDLELKLAASLQQVDKDEKPDMAQIQATQSLISQLKGATAVGRITVEADPASLSADPAQDILLEAGDRIYIPKRPMTVRVAGEVLSPAALQFKSGKDPLEYIREAGGTTYYADKDRAFVIYPDGSAQPLQVSSWNHRATFIPPGSTIIVPRDPKPFNFLEGAERISQILANLAISGLYIDAIGDDD
ncbi:MAG: capsule biosynthesis GfcC family protein [Alphaproteobacteria bacterium]|nr:capsule biosynthesis GfcC family protein [Alphaproteobacteria bacterium]